METRAYLSAAFSPATNFPAGDGLTAEQTADFNGDGKLDIAVANIAAGTVSLLLNTTATGATTPSFSAAQSFATGASPKPMAVADLNGDGLPDLVTASFGSSGVSVLLNTTPVGAATASFTAHQEFAAGSGIDGVAIADINGDGKPDIITANFGSGGISVLLNTTPTGSTTPSFALHQDFAHPDGGPVCIAVGDFNGDGKIDVVADGAVFLNTTPVGSSTVSFAAPVNFPDGPYNNAVQVADFNGDGKPDFAVLNKADPGIVAVLLNTTPTGAAVPSFAAAVTFTTASGSNHNGLTIGDVDGDGKPDLIVGDTDANSVGVLLNTTPAGSTTPSFATNQEFTTDASPISVAVGDFNGDGKIDLAAGNNGASDVSVLLNTTGPAPVKAAKIGGLDPNFGTNGLVSHNVGLTSTCDLLVQPDGKSVIVGTGGASPSQQFALTRYNADGSVDTTFGTGGTITTSLGGDDVAAAGFLLPSGDILVAGTSTAIVNGVATGSEFALAEYTSGGALDTSFGGGTGFVLTRFSAGSGPLSNDVAHAITVTAGGEIFVGGSSDAAGHGQDFAIAAYNADGTAATSFGGNGQALLDFTGGDDSIAALALGPKGSVLAAGSTIDPGTGVGAVALARFLPTGAIDTHFGIKGKVVTSVGGVADGASSVAITPKTGSIVVGGFSATGSAGAGTLSSDFLVLRYTTSGKLDHSFHNSGAVVTNFNQPAAVTRVLAEPDGTIVASGKTTASLSAIDPATLDLAIARYTAKGQLDTTFNGTGMTIIDPGSAVVTSALQPLTSPILQPARVVAFDTASDLMQKLNQLTRSVEGAIGTSPGGDLLDVGNNDANTVEAAIVAMGIDLIATTLSSFPPSVLGGAKGTITLQIKEAGNLTASGVVTLNLFATTAQDTSGQSPFQSVPEKLKLKAGQAKIFRLKFAYPSALSDGNYFILATVDSGAVRDLDTSNNTTPATTPVTIAKPFIDLTGSGLTAPVFVGTKPASVAFTAVNHGNIPTPPTRSSVQFLASSDGSLANAVALAIFPFKPNLKPAMSRVFKVRLALPATLPAGMYHLLVLLDVGNVFNDTDTTNNLIVSDNTFVVGG